MLVGVSVEKEYNSVRRTKWRLSATSCDPIIDDAKLRMVTCKMQFSPASKHSTLESSIAFVQPVYHCKFL